VLSCYNPHYPDIDFGTKLRALKLRRPERLLFIPPIRDHWRIAGLYTSCQAFVAPTRAEGWGLPIIEAMACDLPVIATGYSGLTEFLGAAAYRIDYRLVPVSVPFFLAADGDFGVWAEPDAAHLRRLMRHVFARPDEAQTRGRLGGAEVRQRFTWRRAAAIAADAIRASLAPVQSGIYTSPQDAMSSGQA
ncbi:MAG: glycosyltransferase family 4 protein, partial [Alphaproteobacteria bacterium]|nr:glycosyltransferase family 4 protein [Alphaproteobacteria bacterium]